MFSDKSICDLSLISNQHNVGNVINICAQGYHKDILYI